jgi:hypothetical protein
MTHMYRTKLRIIAEIEVEADSLGEAERIIDGIIEAEVNQLTVYEGIMEDPEDELSGFCERIERDAIERVPE